jgi:hypothetical protein
MHLDHRQRFLRAWSPEVFQQFLGRLEGMVGPSPFRVAETPLLLTHELRDTLARSATEIVGQLSEPELIRRLESAIPPHLDVPGRDALPNCVQVDFALTRDAEGTVRPQVVELQAFPSLYALMTLMSDAWAATFDTLPELAGDWRCFVDRSREDALALLGRTILGSEDPNEVVLVDLEPPRQKTSQDFIATQRLFGVDPVCITEIGVEGNRLFRTVNGKRRPIRRIYNRLVWDEILRRGVKPAFDWRADLDVSWCSHPNWYWVWSKYSLPFLDHPAVPKARFLHTLEEVPGNLSRYVLKPLFSFAGSGVVVDVTPDHLAAIPDAQRSDWVLQEKIDYAPMFQAPDGGGVRAEVRVMLVRPPDAPTLVPLLNLVRMSRGSMMGVDQNADINWVGGSVAMWKA